jgi:hypothetical protein
MTAEGSIIINAHGTTQDLYEIIPHRTSIVGACVSFYDISQGRGESQRRHLLTLSTNGARMLLRWLPLVINAAERITNQRRQRT